MIELVFPLDCWLGLATTAGEVAGANYQRMPTTFVSTVAAENAANETTVEWPAAGPPGGWGTVTAVQVWDAATGGNLLLATAPTAPLVVAAYDRVRLPAGAFIVTFEYLPYGFGRFTFGRYRYGTRPTLVAIAAPIVLRTFDTGAHVCEAGSWVAPLWVPA